MRQNYIKTRPIETMLETSLKYISYIVLKTALDRFYVSHINKMVLAFIFPNEHHEKSIVESYMCK